VLRGRGDRNSPGTTVSGEGHVTCNPGEAAMSEQQHTSRDLSASTCPPPGRVRVIVAEAELMAREAVIGVLDAAPDMEIVAVCHDALELRAAIASETPDVIVTAIRMPPSNIDEGIRVAAELRVSTPTVGVVVLSRWAESGNVLALFAHGTARRAYLLKDEVRGHDELLAAIRAVAVGDSWINPRIRHVLVEARAKANQSPLDLLTPREREVLAAIASGLNNTAISEMLVVNRRSVEKHVNSIYLKLGLSHDNSIHPRVKAALIYLAEGHDATRKERFWAERAQAAWARAQTTGDEAAALHTQARQATRQIADRRERFARGDPSQP
jgi:DNA-binding NarL/FixJ family response regulator